MWSLNPPALLSIILSLSSLTSASLADTPILLLLQALPDNPLPCLRQGYYGSYGGSLATKQHIFLPSSECLNEKDVFGDINQATMLPMSIEFNRQLPRSGRIVWVGQAGLDESIRPSVQAGQPPQIKYDWELIRDRTREILLSRVNSETSNPSNSEDPAQHVFGSSSAEAQDLTPITLLYASAAFDSLILHVPESFLPILDSLLPAHLVPVALPTSPISSVPTSISNQAGEAEVDTNAWDPVPQHLADNLANITSHLRFSPALDKVLTDGLQLDSVRRNVRWLTGEAPSGIESRHSFTEGARKAAHWIMNKVASANPSVKCHFHHFLPGFAPNVICTYPSLDNSTERVILSAHYDSRGSFGETRAPGGDDDGSGTGHLLGIAEAIANEKVEFQKSVTLAFFAGEEQGLYGSYYYAKSLKEDNATVLLHIQADMLAYHAPGETLQLGLPESIGTPSAAHLLGNLSTLYAPELVVGRTAACCSDHQSFHSFGFPATAVFERNGMIADPMYHNSGDLSSREGYDFEQVVSIAKVTMAGVMSVAGWRVGSA